MATRNYFVDDRAGLAVAPSDAAMPEGLEPASLVRRSLLLLAIVVGVALLIGLLPGLSGLRNRLAGAQPGWLAAGVALKLASALSYVVVFRSVFCPRMRWRMSYEVGMSELAANAVVPTGGAGGLALGAWALRRGGMPTQEIARRTVAFFLLTSVANVAGVFVLGIALATGALPGHPGWVLCLVPAGAAVAATLATLAIGSGAGRLRERLAHRHGEHARRVQLLSAVADGIHEALALLRRHEWQLITGAAGYLAFDVMVLWATFHAFGASPHLGIIWMAYLIGELGGLLPVPGGVGGVDAGLVGTLVLYGVGLASASAAVIAYRAIALWVPAAFGGAAFLALRRTLRDESQQLSECMPGTTVDVGLGPRVAGQSGIGQHASAATHAQPDRGARAD